jgi:hypothetical protein
MNRRKKEKPIIAGVEAFPGENSYQGKISGSKDANIYVKKSEEIKKKYCYGY